MSEETLGQWCLFFYGEQPSGIKKPDQLQRPVGTHILFFPGWMDCL